VTDAVTGTVEKQGSDVTDEGGIAEFCYTDTKAGLDLIHAFVDSIDPPLGQSGRPNRIPASRSTTPRSSGSPEIRPRSS
jgi:hypothetical protein